MEGRRCRDARLSAPGLRLPAVTPPPLNRLFCRVLGLFFGIFWQKTAKIRVPRA
jgi:hypothetical protein